MLRAATSCEDPRGGAAPCERRLIALNVAIRLPELAADHFGNMTATDAIRYAKAFEPYNLTWAEDFLDWRDWRGYKRIREASATKLLTGELAFGLEYFL